MELVGRQALDTNISYEKVALNYLSQAWVAVMGIAILAQHIRFLGAESYGLIGSFVTASTLSHTIAMVVVPILTRGMTKWHEESVRDPDTLGLKYTIEK